MVLSKHSRLVLICAIFLFPIAFWFVHLKMQDYPGFTRVGGDQNGVYFVDASSIKQVESEIHSFAFNQLIETSAGEYDVAEAMVDCDSLLATVQNGGHYDRQKRFISTTELHHERIPPIANFVCAEGKGPPLTAGAFSSFQCPESYASDKAMLDALADFIVAYAAKFPKNTSHDLMVYRYRLLVSHSCVRTLQNMLAHVSPTTEMLLFNNGNYGPKTQQFDSNTRVWTVYYTMDGQGPERPDEELVFNFYGWDTARSPSSVTEDLLHRTDNVQVMGNFATPDGVTMARAYVILSETMYPGEPYGYVNVTKITSVGSGAFAVTFSKKIPGNTKTEIDNRVKSWLLSEGGRTTETGIAAVGVNPEWQRYLTGSNGK
jgi:hypothetical protein